MQFGTHSRVVVIRSATMVHDLLAAGCAIVLALSIRHGSTSLSAYGTEILTFVALTGVVGFALGLNGGIWKYASLSDLIAIVKTATISVAIFAGILFVLKRQETFSRTSLLLTFVFTIVLLSATRVMYRMWRNARTLSLSSAAHTRNTLMIGATDGAEMFIKAASEGLVTPYNIVGIVDEHGRRAGRSIRGVRVLGVINNLEQIVANLAQDGLAPHSFILASSNLAAGDTLFESVADIANRHSIDMLRLPDISHLRDEAAPLAQLLPQPLALNDLLPRRPITLDNSVLVDFFGGATVLITGGGGSIGSELCRQLAALKPRRIVVLDNSEFLLHEIETELRRVCVDSEIIARIGDVRSRAQVFNLFDEVRPDLVFHAAALKHVPIVEKQPLEGIATNVLGTTNVADASVAFQARAMVLISTDKAVNPTNVMGASKRMAESYCQSLDVAGETHFVTVRFGNVLGSAGSVVPLFTRQIAAGGPVTVTHPDIERYFMTIPEAVQLVLHATGHGLQCQAENRGRIFVLDMGQPVKIVDVARKMIRLAGHRPDQDIQIKFVGLRPGEKMFEELFEAREPLIATNVPGVLSAGPRRLFDHTTLSAMFKDLGRHVSENDLGGALSVLTRIVPEYVAAQPLSSVIRHESVKNVVPLSRS